jgi:hypothetical protein
MSEEKPKSGKTFFQGPLTANLKKDEALILLPNDGVKRAAVTEEEIRALIKLGMHKQVLIELSAFMSGKDLESVHVSIRNLEAQITETISTVMNRHDGSESNGSEDTGK